jgi:chromate transport protein ChrA
MSKLPRLPEIAGSFPKPGCISFGGPIAHLSYLRDEFVTRRRWLAAASRPPHFSVPSATATHDPS